MLRIGTLTFDYIAEPPRSPVNVSRSRAVLLEGAYDTVYSVFKFPPRSGFLHIFQTERQVGHLTYAQKQYLEGLEASGNPFTVETDLLGLKNSVQSFEAFFDIQQKPVFQSPLADGSWWTYQLPLFLIP